MIPINLLTYSNTYIYQNNILKLSFYKTRTKITIKSTKIIIN